MEVGLVSDLGARLVGEGAQEARKFRVSEVEKAARNAGHLVVTLPGGSLVGDAAGARGPRAQKVREGEAQCPAQGEREVLRGKGKAGARGGRREQGEKATLSRTGEGAMCLNPAVESGRGDRIQVAEAVEVGNLEGETKGLLKPGFWGIDPGEGHQGLGQKVRVVGYVE